jgi:two-component system LytT family response regulator
MNVLIVDDERVARYKVQAVLQNLPEIGHIAECADGAEAVERILEERPDLVVLDVQLPELTGFEVIHAVGPARMPAVVFVTAYDQYAIQAFDVEALDYVVKPFDEERLRVAVERARRRMALNSTGLQARLETLLERVGARTPLDRLAVRLEDRTIVVPVDQIDWIEAADNYVQLHVGEQCHLMRGKISALEAKLDPRRFVRVHRSALVNVDRVSEIRPAVRGEVVVLRDGTRIAVGATRRERLLTRVGIRQ